jgi:hypothetical protein
MVAILDAGEVQKWQPQGFLQLQDSILAREDIGNVGFDRRRARQMRQVGYRFSLIAWR